MCPHRSWWLCPPSWISISLCLIAFVSAAFLRFLWSSFVSLLSLFLFVSFLSLFVSFYVVALCAFLGLCLLLSPFTSLVSLCLPVSLHVVVFSFAFVFFFLVFVSFVCLHSRVVHLRAVRVSLLLSPGAFASSGDSDQWFLLAFELHRLFNFWFHRRDPWPTDQSTPNCSTIFSPSSLKNSSKIAGQR